MTAHANHVNTDWTDEKVEILKDRWERKWTQGQIADALNMSRSAVAGKLNRLGLMGRRGKPRAKVQPSDGPKPVRSAPFRAPKPPKPAGLGPVSGRTASVVIVDDLLPSPEPRWVDCPGKSPGVSLLELTAETCRWPIGEVGAPDFRFCGCTPAAGKPYCGPHALKAVQHG
ncbi:GcrA family cell cycle regulator [Bradyrhizobium sp. 33ap4]|uniref:GcrA family cell cycle regulator n=1 Tax=Bradyrhizobium sp. 33ap4 TaxID=3061630 RepID=UPI0029311B26|nr:GcrA family cell cycle regulator [Bradyrhizobium sp. 33ap4]